MKKILSILGAITLSATSVGAVVSCGLGKKDWHTIYVGIVDNGKDKSETVAMNKAKALFDEHYADLGYKIEFVKYVDENVIPKRIIDMGNTSDIPDVYFPTVDMTSKLATAGVILALEGKNSPWQNTEKKRASILDNLNYTNEGKTESEALIQKMNEVLDDPNNKEGITEDVIPLKEEWNHFLPYAIEASKFQSMNLRAPDDKAVQYGITKHIGVGGGSAIINNGDRKFDAMYSKLGLLPEAEKDWRDKDGNLNWNSKKVSIKRLVEYMFGDESKFNDKDGTEYKQIYTLVDRGMWWMYPLYANAIPDLEDSKDIEKLAASKIGVNWLNKQFKDLGIEDSRGIKYSSIFGNQHYQKSTQAIIEKWFQLYATMVINAAYDLEASPNNPKHNGSDKQASWDYKNLFSVDQNNQVQANLLKNGWAAGINYEPGSYFDMLDGFKLFGNMDYAPLSKIEIFDSRDEEGNDEKTTAGIYSKAGLNTWLTPAGSGQAVFNTNLINPSVDPNFEKAEAAMRFVETTFGFYKDLPKDEEAVDEQANPIVGHGDGGIRNLKDQFAQAGDNPVQLAILDKRNQDTEFEGAMENKVTIKFNRAKDENALWWDQVKGKEDLQQQERDAIMRLETTSIQLASDLYRRGGSGLSLAPNRSAFDEAGADDYHGVTAMQASLLQFMDDDSSNIADWTLETLKEKSKQFAVKLMDILAKQDVIKSNAES